jgi:hypothetical protein
MLGDDLEWIKLIVVGSASGFVSGLLGIGGGVIIVPALILTLPHFGVSGPDIPKIAMGTSLALVVPTSIASAQAHAVRDAIDWPLLGLLAPAIIAGAFSAAFLVPSFSTHAFCDVRDRQLMQFAAACGGANIQWLASERCCYQVDGRDRRRRIRNSGNWRGVLHHPHTLALYFDAARYWHSRGACHSPVCRRERRISSRRNTCRMPARMRRLYLLPRGRRCRHQCRAGRSARRLADLLRARHHSQASLRLSPALRRR